MIITEISVENYKSIRKLDKFALGKLNVLIGANGVGKSNFISFLRLLKNVADKNLQNHVSEQGGANSLLYFGVKNSQELKGTLYFSSGNAYKITLKPSNEDSFYFADEYAAFKPQKNWHALNTGDSGYKESKLDELIAAHQEKHKYGGIPEYVKHALTRFEIYHFHDTGRTSPMKQPCNVDDNRFLRKDGSNLPAFLFYLKETKPNIFRKIEGTVKSVAPFLDSFILEPLKRFPEKIRLEWKEKNSDTYFNAHSLSDGTLRFIALATLLQQPNPPKTIIIDEPELGLHPSAINILAGLIRSASIGSQIILSTQSVTLVNQFGQEDLIIVERKNDQTEFRRLNHEEIKQWLDDYSLGEAWEKNVIGGRPS
jgi:predicted ATPase